MAQQDQNNPNTIILEEQWNMLIAPVAKLSVLINNNAPRDRISVNPDADGTFDLRLRKTERVTFGAIASYAFDTPTVVGYAMIHYRGEPEQRGLMLNSPANGWAKIPARLMIQMDQLPQECFFTASTEESLTLGWWLGSELADTLEIVVSFHAAPALPDGGRPQMGRFIDRVVFRIEIIGE